MAEVVQPEAHCRAGYSASTGIALGDLGVEAGPAGYFEALALHRHWERGNAAATPPEPADRRARFHTR